MVVSAVTITALDGPVPDFTVVLEGRALPYRAANGGSVAYEINQRVQTTWYPGSDDASQQVIGATYSPTTFSGQWKQRYLPADAVQDLIDAFTNLCRNGTSVQVVWDRYVRIGLITNFRFTPGVPTGGAEDVGWEFTVTWRGAQVPVRALTKVSTATFKERLLEVSAALFNSATAIDIFLTTISSFVGKSRNWSDGIYRVLNGDPSAYQETLDKMDDDLLRVSEIQKGTLAFGVGTAAQTQEALTVAKSTQASLGSALFRTTDLEHAQVAETDGVVSEVLGRVQRSNLVGILEDGLREVFQSRSFFDRSIRPDIQVTITPNPGTDLRAVALRFYGNADSWRRIARVNGLVDSTIPEALESLTIPLTGNLGAQEEVC